MACRTGCLTKNHESYAACLRDGAARIAYANSAGGWDATTQKKWDSDLTAYREARAAGVQPASTKRSAVDAALRASDSTGTAFRADA